MDVNALSAPGEVQDPALDTTTLPENHPAKFLADAKRVYKGSRPPFVTSGSKFIEGSKREVFIAKNGQRPPLPTRANLVTRRWGPLASDGIYWTLDLNGERLIVQSFPNKGCVSGAKWIYCCWTGVGEEFEDLPSAFTCINGEYTSTLGPKSEYAAKRANTKNHESNTTKTNKTTLPEDHPVEYLDEAEALYMNSRPPFALHRTKLPRRRVFLATKDGRFSPTSTEAEVVYRMWDSVDDYGTLDLERKRFIVIGNPGGPPGGYQYHLWLGSQVGRVQKVAAYGGPLAPATQAASNLTGHGSKQDEGLTSSLPSDHEEAQDSEAPTGPEEFRYDNFISAFDPTATPPPAPLQFQIRHPIPSSDSSAHKRCSPRKSKPTKRARSSTPSGHLKTSEDKTPAHDAKRITRPIRHISDKSSELSDPPYGTPTLTPNTNDHPTPTFDAQRLQIQEPTSFPTLTPQKQTHTTLRVTRDSNIIGFVPLRLSSCMSMATLFSSVVAASGHKECEEPIKCLMVVFDWKDEHDVYKTIYIDKGTQGSFEIFLEIIDEAPCWKEDGGKCGIAVEIIRT